jgi:hypothetical protein
MAHFSSITCLWTWKQEAEAASHLSVSVFKPETSLLGIPLHSLCIHYEHVFRAEFNMNF